MERKIGEIFECNGEWYQCIVGNGCENCAFNGRKCYIFTDNSDPIGECCADRRRDNKDVIFKKLEKVGEPIEYDGELYQGFKAFDNTITEACNSCTFNDISCGDAVECDTGVFLRESNKTKKI